jgi:hypothetical protein
MKVTLKMTLMRKKATLVETVTAMRKKNSTRTRKTTRRTC